MTEACLKMRKYEEARFYFQELVNEVNIVIDLCDLFFP